MLARLKKFLASVLFGPKTEFNNVSNSTIFSRVYNNAILIFRPAFVCEENWLTTISELYYDEEIKSKYIAELHQEVDEHKYRLVELLRYDSFLQNFLGEISSCFDYIQRYEESRDDFYQVLQAEGKADYDASKTFLAKSKVLENRIPEIKTSLNELRQIVTTKDFGLFQKFRTLHIPDYGYSSIQSGEVDLSLLFDEIPEDPYLTRDLTKDHDQVYQLLSGIKRMVENTLEQGNNYIISGNAGSGKTNLCAHLIKILKDNDEFVIFLKPTLFNGDDVNFETRLLQRLKVQEGYILTEVLTAINNFAKAKGKRCVIIIDALNETTKAGIGFSNIWKNELQSFINTIRLFPNLFLVCTLRTSYIDHIWKIRPGNLYEIDGFNDDEDVLSACRKYFKYYRINATNLGRTDLTHFKVPLLLDLFCKMTNPNRLEEITIHLGIETYVSVFSQYIETLVNEVRNKLNLQKTKLIKQGFDRSSDLFCANNDATLELEEFNDAFDPDDHVTEDLSIAKSVLEGYLIFIKDASGSESEFIKHTQQEVGGYLLARRLLDRYPELPSLISTEFFQDGIVGADQTKQHQLRLDIIKFLIALNPQIIQFLDSREANNVSWWYVFNGGSERLPANITADLLQKENQIETRELLRISRNVWLSPQSKHNFHFVAKLLFRQSQWDIDKNWTSYIYQNSIFFQQAVERYNLMLLEQRGSKTQLKLAAIFCAYTCATTLRNLRDLSTAFLVNFGKKYPKELLGLTVENAGVADGYIYERLVSSCYGVALNLQNDKAFTSELLPVFAKAFYELQFAPAATNPVYNYVVIDSIKHLLELEFFKNGTAFGFNTREQVVNYRFQTPKAWVPPTEEQQQLVDQSSEHSWPEPIGMDFGIYTIPRLIDREQIPQRTAIANVYKRIYELGYQNIRYDKFDDRAFRNFYNGEKLARRRDKADRLGKKYSWLAFFDYAGFLLLNRKLAGYSPEDIQGYRYSRLGDVDIDISKPNTKNQLSVRLYPHNLMAARAANADWHKEVKIDTIFPLIQHEINGSFHTMLYGKVDQRVNEEYKTRSFLLAESFFIARNDKTDAYKISSSSMVYDWKNDVSFFKDDIRHIYFGELYWLGIGDNEAGFAHLPTNEIGKRKRKASPFEIFSREIPNEKIKKVVEEEYIKTLNVDVQSSLCEYLWETDSEVFPAFSEYFPSIKMGKELHLSADPAGGRILDKELAPCFEVVKYTDQEYFSNDFNYMRSDLLKKYMENNNLTLVFQIKQHSYTEQMDHNRAMSFFLLNAEEINI
ncbi:MAG: ATP-binding protein [Mucilaginibacter sp.]|uniref:hypothetical protein n=1 Tax=Mucilaginibacter sp. TaxID=1882438 RepID=UPI003563B589